MDAVVASLIVTWSLWGLVTLLSLIVLYWVIRLAIVGALRSHARWVRDGNV